MEWIAAILALAALAGVAWLLIGRLPKPAAEGTPPEIFRRLDAVRSDLQNQLGGLRSDFLNNLNAIRQELGQNVQGVQTALVASGQALKDVGTQLGTLAETAKQIQAVGKDVASLQELLRPPKIRGELGEQLLEDLLAQCLPKDRYRLQHQYRDGTRVDALVCLAQGSIPVDAKFPLESFARLMAAQSEEEVRKVSRELERQVKGHIDSVAGYIRAAEGTLDFALMYIPAENVYYEVAVKGSATSELMKYAQGKRVFPVSPNTFYAYLQAIALGLRGLQIEQRAKEVYAQVSGVQQQLADFQERFEVVGRHIRNALDRYGEAERLLTRTQATLSSFSSEPEKKAPGSDGAS